MNEVVAKFVERSGARAPVIGLWPPVVIPKEQIEEEVRRLASGPTPANGRRASLIVHPYAQEPGPGLAPGIQVSLNVLLPGERTAPIRHNSTQVNFCIQGAGHTVVNGETIRYTQYDVWVHPSMAVYTHVNDTDRTHVRLTYSNAALLEKLNIHYVEDDPAGDARTAAGHEPEADEAATPFADLIPLDGGAQLMSYERLVNPPVVEQRPLHWPWAKVRAELDKLAALGKNYVGRRLYLLYNPATGRTNGTTNNFFAAITIRPPSIVDKPHRHTSAAINYFFGGSGRSVVEKQTYRWKAGDLMLTAPGFAVHNHASDDQPVYELTIQDQPLNLAMDSLIWQEDLREAPRVLGSQPGFATNRAAVPGS